MASFATLYVSPAGWTGENQLHQTAQDHSSSLEIDTSSERRSSVTSLSSGPSFSPASSIIPYSRPSTPLKDTMEYNGSISYFRHGPVTPSSMKVEFAPHLSPYTHQDICGVSHLGANVDSVQWRPVRYTTQNGPDSNKGETSATIRTHGSFVSDTSSFSSPTSVGGYSEDDVQQALWNIDGLKSGVESGEMADQVPTSLAISLDMTIWDDDFLRHTPEYTVNPSDTITTTQDSFSTSETQSYRAAFAPLVDSSCIDAAVSTGNPTPEEIQAREASQPSTRRSKRVLSEKSNPASKRKAGTISPSKSDAGEPWKSALGAPLEVKTFSKAEIFCPWETCKSKFTRQEHLTRHYKIHTGERDYICALAVAGGDVWHKLKKEPHRKNYSRPDNQRDHYLTHLKGGGRNKCADRMFLYWCIRKYEPERAIGLLEKMENTRKRRNLALGPVEVDLQMAHPDWPEYVAWRDARVSVKSKL